HTDRLADLGLGVFGAVQGDRLVVGGGQGVDVGDEAGRAHAQGEELDAAAVEFAEDFVGGDLLVHDRHAPVGAAGLFPVVAEGDGLLVLGGFGQVGVGVDEVVGAGVLGEEGEHGAGALGAGGHVALFQDRVVSPVHDGVEVQVEDGLVGGGQPLRDHD